MIKELEVTNKHKSDFEFKMNEIDVDIEDYADQAENLRDRLKNLKNQNLSICDADCEQLEELQLVLSETLEREAELLKSIKDLDVQHDKIQAEIAKSIDLEKIARQNSARVKTELDYYSQLADSKSKKQQQDVQKKLSELFEKEKKIRFSVDEIHSRQKDKEDELAKIDEQAHEVYEMYKLIYQTCQAKIKSYESKVQEIEMNFVKEYRELLVHWRADTYANNASLNRLLRNDP